MQQITGMLAPDGSFYYCNSGGHLELCCGLINSGLYKEEYNSMSHGNIALDSEEFLINKGWIEIRDQEIYKNYQIPITNQQINWFIKASEHVFLNSSIRESFNEMLLKNVR